MADNFNTIEGTEVFNVNDAVQGSHALTLDDVKNFVSSGADKFHTNIVGTAPYDPLNPLAGWVAPSNPIQDNTVEVKFTDGTVGNYTFDGSVWGLDFINEWAEQRICLNTAAVTFTPLDINNPTTAEVQAYAASNLSLEQRNNGTKLVYFVPLDGGTCDIPDYEWTLNDYITIIENKSEKESNIIHVDTEKGSDITGIRQYVHRPFKSFSAAMSTYQNGDVLKTYNTDIILNTTLTYASNSTTYLDFGTGKVYLNSNLFNNALNDATSKNISIKSYGEFIATPSTLINNFGSGSNAEIHLNKVYLFRSFFSSRGNLNLYIKYLNRINGTRVFWFNGTNKKININVENCDLTSTTIGGYEAGVFNVESNSIPTEESMFNLNIDNIYMNVYQGYISDIGASTIPLKDCNINIKIRNLLQNSDYSSYILGGDYLGNFQLFRNNAIGTALFENNIINLNINNAKSDLSLICETANTGAVTNSVININAIHTCVKLPSLYLTGNKILDNTKYSVTGTYTNTSTHPIIIVNGFNLTNNSVIKFDGDFMSNTNIYLQNLTIDATSKIVFKGRYELGNGYFDISGVTGAGADNVYFEDCTIVTNNAECIVSGTAKNVKILDVRSNKPTSANVTELVSSIIVNSNIN